MNKKICLTGIKPTGNPHLGNYLGAIRPAIKMAQSGEYAGYYFIADYHSLTAVHNGKELNQYIYDVAATWMAFGLDPNQVVLYQQSHIPEVLELHWILSCFTAKGHMNRAHAYKAIVQENENNGRDPDLGVNIGIYTYPVLMSADILLLQSDVVPVGPDQLQHLEIAREIAQSFNFVYGNLLKLPKALEQNVPLIPGSDGRKMSKSYQNTIPLFASEKDLRKHINRIKTDSLPPEVPKNPDDSLIFTLYKFFATPEEVDNLKAWYLRGIGWGDAKAQLFEVINRELQLPRQRYQELIANKPEIDRILNMGAEQVRSKSQALLKKIKKTIGVI
ncbi:MAG: tryptophan--tRNA ligase [Bdellovibrio sp.]|nr:tryptophan--tRNA ligase [Bdellovibrio sp.]